MSIVLERAEAVLHLNQTPLRINPTTHLRNTHARGMVSVHGGKLKLSAPSIKDPRTASEHTPMIQSDLSGFHKLAVVQLCSKSECKTTNCAGNGHQNPCNDTATGFLLLYLLWLYIYLISYFKYWCTGLHEFIQCYLYRSYCLGLRSLVTFRCLLESIRSISLVS